MNSNSPLTPYGEALQKIVQLQEKLEFAENRLKLSDDAFDALQRKVKGLQKDLTETNLLLSKVVEERNDAYAEIKKLQEGYKAQAILFGVK